METRWFDHQNEARAYNTDDGTCSIELDDFDDDFLVVDLTDDRRLHTWSDDPTELDSELRLGRMGIFTAHTPRGAVEIALATWYGLLPDKPGRVLVWNEDEFIVFRRSDGPLTESDPLFATFSLRSLLSLSRVFGDRHPIVGVLEVLRESSEAQDRLSAAADGERDRDRRWLRLLQTIIQCGPPPRYTAPKSWIVDGMFPALENAGDRTSEYVDARRLLSLRHFRETTRQDAPVRAAEWEIEHTRS
jgi:hypothetical protein